ncbi:MAG: beta galactosidase jelly roll domain-containing protein, partial [Clostridiales bacterium]|nr:beta galactosidase jelly roll domain-containing protein [Clostridiales bacterium]
MIIGLNKHWKFRLGDAPTAWQKDFEDTDWDSVTLPHDWAVSLEFSRENSSGTGYLPGGTGWYRTRFTLPEAGRDKKIWVVFDGVYKNSQVWVNGYNLGNRPYGYSTFRYDITDFAAFGETENVLSVRVVHEDIADSRWYTGSGITRKVSLEIQEKLYFDEYGVFFSLLPTQNGVRIRNTLVNETGCTATGVVINRLLDAEGGEAAVFSSAFSLAQDEKKRITIEGTVDDPKLWSPEAPYLYTLVSEIQIDGQPHNRRTERVGMRAARFCPDTGFYLNDRNMKLKGVCVHHDGGCLGAAVPKTVWRRRLSKLKAMGCNAIRMSHNPHAPELYELCDELGFLVIDEAFDEWEGVKNKWSTGHNVYPPKHQGYAEHFPEWHERDLKAMVRRDRNHASVILWSIGNEIDYPNDPYAHPRFDVTTGNNDASKPSAERVYNPNRPNMERISVLARRLVRMVKEEDDTRPVTSAVAFPELSTYIGFIDALDVVGYNYKEQFYEQDHRRFPDKPFLGTENSRSFHAWQYVTDNDYVAGQFLWTGIDFLGETSGWPKHGSS